MAAENTYLRENRALSDAIIETARLRLRPFHADDAEAFWQMRSNPDVMLFIPLEVATNRADIYAEFAHDLAKGERFKFFNAVEWKDPPAGKDGFMIGWVLFRPTEEGQFVEVGYWFLPEAWGQGLASEAASAMIEGHRHAMGVALADVCADVYVGHPASRRVLEKIGLEVTGEKLYQGRPAWVFNWKI